MAATEFIRISNAQPITNIEGKGRQTCETGKMIEIYTDVCISPPIFLGQISTNVEKAWLKPMPYMQRNNYSGYYM